MYAVARRIHTPKMLTTTCICTLARASRDRIYRHNKVEK